MITRLREVRSFQALPRLLLNIIVEYAYNEEDAVELSNLSVNVHVDSAASGGGGGQRIIAPSAITYDTNTSSFIVAGGGSHHTTFWRLTALLPADSAAYKSGARTLDKTKEMIVKPNVLLNAVVEADTPTTTTKTTITTALAPFSSSWWR